MLLPSQSSGCDSVQMLRHSATEKNGMGLMRLCSFSIPMANTRVRFVLIVVTVFTLALLKTSHFDDGLPSPKAAVGDEKLERVSRPFCLRPNLPDRKDGHALNRTTSTLQELDGAFSQLDMGGHSEPKHCRQRQRVGILIPIRGRWDQLPILIGRLHGMLPQQWRHYTIFVIEQIDNAPFNRGKLLNVGAIEAVKREPDLNCFILHDVDTVPKSFRTLYKCHEDRRLAVQMATYQQKRNYRLNYRRYTGGVFAIWRSQFENINGLSNEFWGWGGEDDDLANRIRNAGFDVVRDISRRTGSYFSLDHPPAVANPNRTAIIKNHMQHLGREGLNTTDYLKLSESTHRTFTLFTVDIATKRVSSDLPNH